MKRLEETTLFVLGTICDDEDILLSAVHYGSPWPQVAIEHLKCGK